MTTDTTVHRIEMKQSAPQFRVPDVVRTAEWYRDMLGFEIGGYYRPPGHADDEPVFAHVRRDGILFQIGKLASGEAHPNSRQSAGSLDAYVWVQGVRPLFAEFQARGVPFVWELIHTDYDMWEFAVLDCDGHSIGFGE